mgnify:CR=1 FL=1
MAAGAVVEAEDTFLAVLAFDFSRIVLVASVAIISCQISRVADATGVNPALAMIEGEGVRLVEESRRPACRIVTGGTRFAKQTRVVLRLKVAGGAFLRCALKNVASVAIRTGDIHVRPCEGESRQRVVKGGILPPFGGMALGAILTELPLVCVVCLVAGVTLLGCALEYAVHMAGFTCQDAMRSCQRERRQGMVKGSALPTFGCMALGAVLTKAPGMGIILGVAGETVRWSVFQVSRRARPNVASSAIRAGVFPLEGKSLQVMIECGAVGIYAIVTNQAPVAESRQVALHICWVNILVAGEATRYIHRGNPVPMTVQAGESDATCGCLMPLERKASRFMRKSLHIQDGQRCLRSVVLGVAGVTLPGCALRQHDRMEVIRTGDQVLVTDQTTVCHSFALPDRCVAGGATPAGFGVGRNAPQWL